MPKREAVNITRELVAEMLANLPSPTPVRLWDRRAEGLCLRADSGRNRAYWAFAYRTPDGRQRQVTVGPASLPLPEARDLARKIAGDIARGSDPLAVKQQARAVAMTVGEAWQTYFEHKQPTWKPRSKAIFQHHATTKILPSLGDIAMPRLDTATIERWHRQVTAKNGSVAANRALALLSGIVGLWIRRESPGSQNPCADVARNRETRRERYLSLEEIGRLWLAVDELLDRGPERAGKRVGQSLGQGGRGQREALARGITRHQGALIKLLLLTGCRLGEVQTVTWEQVRLSEAVMLLDDSKTGRRRIILPSVAVEILAGLAPQATGPVIIGRDGQRGLNDIRRAWSRVCRLAAIEGATPHSLRHTTATVMASVGAPVLAISAVLGHAIATTNATAGYLHAATEAEARVWLERAVARIVEAVERASLTTAEAIANEVASNA